MQLIGPLTGQTVLDVACGDGFYTRLLRQQGARKVTGVDLSERMIELARQQESKNLQGIDFLVGDARHLALPDRYDLVVAAYLLNYAQNRDELRAMCNGIAGCLKPGGRFVTVNGNPALDFPNAPSYRKYGFETSVVGKWQEGCRSNGPFTWKTAPSPLRITTSTLRFTRKPCIPQGFRRFTGNVLVCRPRVKPPSRRITGRAY